MRTIKFAAAILMSLSCAAAQTKCSSFGEGKITGQQFVNEKLGLTYVFPAGMTPQPVSTVPAPAVKSDTAYLLLLWKTPRDIQRPSIILMTDNPSAFVDTTALGYARRIENTITSSKVMREPESFDLSGRKFYRLDYQFPGANGPYEVAVTGQVSGCELTFQISAKTKQEAEELVGSLKSAKIEVKTHKQKK